MKLYLSDEGMVMEVYIKISYYVKNFNLFILLYYWSEEGLYLPWTRLTVNLGIECEKDCAYIDVNNNGPEILDWLTTNKLAVPTGRVARSGYVEYPEYRFDAAVLNLLDADGYREYCSRLEQQKGEVVRNAC